MHEAHCERWSQMTIVSSQDRSKYLRETTEEEALLPHARSQGKGKKSHGKASWEAKAVEVPSWFVVGSWTREGKGERERENRENERMRERRVFRQLGKPSRDRSREDFFLGNMLCFPHLTPFFTLSSLAYACSLSSSLSHSFLPEFCSSSQASRDRIFREQIKAWNIGEFRIPNAAVITRVRTYRISPDKWKKWKKV